jgi:hypothetical protein
MNERVHHSHQKPFSQIRGAAIAIREVDRRQRHTGILYRDSGSGEVFLLHLAWHFDLRHDAPRESYLWVDPTFAERRLAQVAAICRLVWKANGKGNIPFGFSPPSDCLDAETGTYLFGPSRVGLTCATFVLAVFHRAGLALLEYATWPLDRPEDREWQKLIVDSLRGSDKATPEHLRAVERDVGTTARFRPEEVAGAATITPIPVQFQLAEERSREILVRLRNPYRYRLWESTFQFLHRGFAVLRNWVRKNILGR